MSYLTVRNIPWIAENSQIQECKCGQLNSQKDLVRTMSSPRGGLSVNNVESNNFFGGDNYDNDNNWTKHVSLSAMLSGKNTKRRYDTVHSRLTDNSVRATQSVNSDNSVITAKPVYNETALLRRIKEIHDSMYTPPTNETCRRRLPQCVIIGMKKCGTQELIDFLSMHPNIVRRGKPVYEINCFLSDERLGKCKRWMPCSYSDQITMTKSSIYFTTPSVPERLYKYNNTLKMILLVREPVERLLSDYSFEFFQRVSKHGKIIFENSSNVYTNMSSLDRKLVNRFSGKVKENVPEVVKSTYDIAMVRYLSFFRQDQILVIESKQLKTDPINVLRKVESFLGLEHKIKIEDFVFNKEKGFYCVRSDPGMVCYGDNRGRNATTKITIEPDTKAILRNYFRKHNERFYRLIGKKFDW